MDANTGAACHTQDFGHCKRSWRPGSSAHHQNCKQSARSAVGGRHSTLMGARGCSPAFCSLYELRRTIWVISASAAAARAPPHAPGNILCWRQMKEACGGLDETEKRARKPLCARPGSLIKDIATSATQMLADDVHGGFVACHAGRGMIKRRRIDTRIPINLAEGVFHKTRCWCGGVWPSL